MSFLRVGDRAAGADRLGPRFTRLFLELGLALFTKEQDVAMFSAGGSVLPIQ